MSNTDYSNIPAGWLDLVRHTLARCTNNKGAAAVTIRAIVVNNRPVMWLDAQVERIQPMRAPINYPQFIYDLALKDELLDIGSADNSIDNE